jgi:L-rhamnose-H+ transport protein
MNPNPALGVFFHWLGGLASGSFYVPYKGVKHWAWETYWLAGGFFSWIIAPWILASFLTKDLFAVLGDAPGSALFWAFFFGLLWGVGGLTFGLTMRYLGLSLGMAVVLGLCAAFGTLMPPIFRGVFLTQVVGTTSGRVILFGIFVCLAGITAAGLAGISKERVMSREQQKAAIEEFDLRKGIGVAILSGVMSACFAYGLAAGDPIKALTLRHGTAKLWQGLPVLIVVLVGGFLTNFIWCLVLLLRNKTGYQFFHSQIHGDGIEDEPIIETAFDAPSREVVEQIGTSRPLIAREAVIAEARPAINNCAGTNAAELPALRFGRNHLVFPVLLLHHGREPNGSLRILELDAAHGQHHHFQQPLGNRIQGVEGRGSSRRVAAHSGPVSAGRVHGDRRLWKLSRAGKRRTVTPNVEKLTVMNPYTESGSLAGAGWTFARANRSKSLFRSAETGRVTGPVSGTQSAAGAAYR